MTNAKLIAWARSYAANMGPEVTPFDERALYALADALEGAERDRCRAGLLDVKISRAEGFIVEVREVWDTRVKGCPMAAYRDKATSPAA